MRTRHRWILLLPVLGLTLAASTPSAAQACDQPLKVSFLTLASSFGTGAFDVADPNRCGWQATTQTASTNWLTTTAGFSGRGLGTVRFNVSTYTGASMRVAVLRAGNEFLVVRQNSQSSPPAMALNPSTIFTGDAFSTATVAVTASSTVAWQSTADGFPFLSVTNGFSGRGNGAVSINIQSNSLAPRVGVVAIGTAILTVVQRGPAALTCDKSLLAVSPSALAFPSGGGRQAVQLNAPSVCSSAAASPATWLTISPRNAVGAATLTVTASSTGAQRTTTITVGGHTVSVQQSGPNPPACSQTVTPTQIDVPAAGGVFPIDLTSVNCPAWSIVAPTGISATPSAGTGSTQIRLTVEPNRGAARTLVVNAAGATVTLRQAPSDSCPRAILSAASLSFGKTGGTVSVGVDISAGCRWLVVGMPGDVTATPSVGTGPELVTVSMPPNSLTQRRVFSMNIAGTEITVSQDAAGCDYVSTVPTNQIPREGGTVTAQVLGSAGCGPAQVTVPSWVSITSRSDSSGAGTVTFAVAQNPAPAARRGTLRIGGTSTILSQAGEPPNGTTFDGSNISIPWTQDASTATWRGSGGSVHAWALPGDKPSPIDGDGDGVLDIRVVRELPGTSVYYLLPSSGSCPALYEFEGMTGDGNPVCRRFFGRAGDVPLRFNGDDDTLDDLAVYRVASNTLLLTTSSGSCPVGIPPSEIGYDGRWICAAVFGLPGDRILVADVTGDRKTDLVMWRPSSGFFHVLPSDGVCPIAGCQIQWGLSGDQPVLGRFIDRSRSAFAVYRPSEGNWYLASLDGTCPTSFRNAGPAHSGITMCVRNLGLSNDLQVHQDYDGDGFDDIAVFRPSSLDWFVVPSSGACPAAVPTRFTNSDGNAACRLRWGIPGSTPIVGIR